MKKICMILCVFCLCFSMSACKKKTEEVVINTIGEKSENAYEILLTNETGMNIKGIEVNDEAVSLEGVFKDGEQRTFYYEAKNEKEEKGDFIVSSEYTLRLTMEDDTSYELHIFPFKDMKECTLKKDGDIFYVEYESISSKEKVNTFEAEKALVQPVQEIQEEPVPEPVPEPAQAPVVDTQVNEYVPVYEPQQPEQSEGNGCLDGGLVY
ncbi:MAG: hypothetical protein HUJ53_11150 [Holdemanella sp.]|nr:hypothetical protein [Holdemanella sp.]